MLNRIYVTEFFHSTFLDLYQEFDSLGQAKCNILAELDEHRTSKAVMVSDGENG